MFEEKEEEGSHFWTVFIFIKPEEYDLKTHILTTPKMLNIVSSRGDKLERMKTATRRVELVDSLLDSLSFLHAL